MCMPGVGHFNGNGAIYVDLLAHRQILEELIKSSQALTALLITRQGTVLASAGEVDYLNTTAVAALVAAMFTATREVARLVGEKQFSILMQQGEMRHLHISLVSDLSMMVIVFEDHNRTGMIRHCAKKAAGQLSELSQPAKTATPAEVISLPRFKEYALNLIDRIFEPHSE